MMTLEIAETTGTVSVSELAKFSGLEFFERVIAGEFPPPPLTGQIPMRITEVASGHAVWETRPPEWFVNPMGQLHGGYVMTVIDSACGCAVHSALAAGQGFTTVETKVNMTRAIPWDGSTLRAVGTLITLGRRIGTSEAKIYDQKGRVVAFGTSSCLIFDLPV